MFKKPLDDLKTSGTSIHYKIAFHSFGSTFVAPLRSSDRRKFKQRVIQEFSLQDVSSEDGDRLVPDGLLSVKFSTHSGEPGVCSLWNVIELG